MHATTGPPPLSPSPRRARAPLLYLLLAALDLLMVVTSLGLSHRVTELHASSLETNQLWAERLTRFSALEELSGEVNAPGNDVFHSHDPAQEAARLARARARYDAAMVTLRAECAEIEARAPLLERLDAVDEGMRRMTTESDHIFELLAGGGAAASAAERMATMDRCFAEVRAAIGGLRQSIRDLQRAQFDQQHAGAARLRRFDYVIAGFILFMVLAVALYGSFLHRQTNRYEAALEQHGAVQAAQAEALRLALARAEAANLELTAFSYSVSHDLLAPLRGIDGWSLALAEDYGPKLDDAGRGYISRVRSEGHRMGELIRAMLDMSKLAQTELAPTLVDLSAVARATVERLREEQPDRTVEALIQPGLEAVGGETLVRKALENLLENAWKFTSKRPSARIEVGRVERDGEAVFFVRDDGAGFDLEYARRLFTPFQRMHKQTEFPGTGVGLANVQRVVRRHGGRIWAEAAVDRGATFYFTLSPRSAVPCT